VNWPADPSSLIADANALRGTKGIALLLRMGSFDLWRGSLAQMRGDSSAVVATTRTDGSKAERFLRTLAVSQALDSMPPKCTEMIRLAYFEGRDVHRIAQDLQKSVRYAANLVDNCTERLLEAASAIYQELSRDDSDEAEPNTHSPIPLSARAEYDDTSAERK
jgi:hypothetical protein